MMALRRVAAPILALALGAALTLAPGPHALAAPTNADCLACHGDDETLSMTRGGHRVSLWMKPGVLSGSAHAKVACVECHVGFDPDEEPHRKTITPVACTGSCHGNVAAKHTFHEAMVTEAFRKSGAGACKSCHGTHDVRRAAHGASVAADAKHPDAACEPCHRTEVEHYRRSAHGRAAAQGMPEAPTCVSCHEKGVVTGAGPTTVDRKVEQEKLCLSCHLDDPKVRARVGPKAGFIAAYDKSVHGAALHAGKVEAPTCVDCHGSHDMAKGYDENSLATKSQVAATCGKCHDKIAAQYRTSVHGVAMAKGNLDSPVCTDCHGEHGILKAKDPNSPVAPANVSERVCSPCHSSVKLESKYGIRNDRFKTFTDSFHGLAIRGGSVSAANCASCHGSHGILPSTDPRSTVAPANLVKTCGKCHSGASAAFAKGKVHVDASEAGSPLLFWIGMIYTVLIGFTIGGMFLHNVLDFVRKSIHRLKVRRGLAPAEHHGGTALYVRMTKSERIQHALLVVSFTTLVLTGFALRYPEAWLFEGIRRFSNTIFEWRGIVHRIAGVVMVLASLAHVVYLRATERGRQFLRDIMLRPSDLKQAGQALRFYLGRTRERPRLGRFSYIEKSEYWALVWGTIVMATTGVVLWFQDPMIALVSKLGWDAARLVHVYEAVLATLAILVWHLYFVIFNPDVYPMNLAWLQGTLSEEEMRDEHPLELEAIEQKRHEEEIRALEAARVAEARAATAKAVDATPEAQAASTHAAARSRTEDGRG
jgi:cytochrome b subunit of formate dehydrogenase